MRMLARISIFVFVLLPICVAANAQIANGAPAETVTVIRAGTLIDGTSNAARTNQIIIIRGNRIAAVGDAATTPIPAGARVIDLSHATVLPGLIESHTHLFLQGEEPDAGGYDVQLLKYPISYRAARATVSARRAL